MYVATVLLDVLDLTGHLSTLMIKSKENNSPVIIDRVEMLYLIVILVGRKFLVLVFIT